MLYDLMDLIAGRPVVGFGCGEYVDRALANSTFEIDYFVDDAEQGRTKNGRPIVGLDRLAKEERQVAIVVFSRHVPRAIMALSPLGYSWGRDVFDGRYFGLGGSCYDEYEFLAGLPEIARSPNIDVFLGPNASLHAFNLVLPRNVGSAKVKIYVGANAQVELDRVVIDGGASLYVGRRGRITIGRETIIGADCRLGASAEAALSIGEEVLLSRRSVLDAATGVSIVVGDHSTFGEHLELYAYAPITIGNDCMFSGYIYAESGAGHDLVIDGERREPKDLIVGDHVWVGMGATLLAGGSVGSGSMIAAKSLLNRPVGNAVLAAGNPARVVQEQIIWDRDYTAYKELYHRRAE